MGLPNDLKRLGTDEAGGAVGFLNDVRKALLIAFAGFAIFSAVLMVLSLEAA